MSDLPRDLTSVFERPAHHSSVTMTNLANQLPSYDSDAIAQANSSYFCLPTGRTPAEIERNQVVVKKEKRGEEGSKQFTSNYTAATEALKPGFGAAKHFVQRSKDGEEADAGNTNYTYIQEFFCSNLTKVDSLEHRVISYDFKDILMLRELRDVNQDDPRVKWGPPKYYLLKDFAKLSLHIVLEHQADTNMFCSKHDQQSSDWLYALVFNSMTVELRDRVIPTYNEIPSSQQGGITLTKLVLDEIFFMSRDVINALKNFLKIFESKGLTRIQGENVSVITKQLHAAVVSLDEVGALPDETYGDILRGFTKCSNEDFKAVFQHLLTQERIDHFSSRSPIATSSYGSPSSEPTIAKIKRILCDANDLYNNFATSNKWVVNCRVTACFNCGGDHGLNPCNEPCDQNCIAQNKAKFEEERNHASGGGHNGGGRPCGGRHSQGQG